ncbi:MAG TPA: alpha/beta hydrolase [Brumimicrobium sp.]|nr:alpha/beta hydrolase [Brumimicrobium sp.]
MKHLNWFTLVVMIFIIHHTTFSQKEKEVKVKTEDGTLYGSLISVAEKNNAPIVIIIPGSGPTDRNGNSMLVQGNSYRFLAEDLAKEGIASLRYDKLMIGKSKSDLTEQDLTFEKNVGQVTAWIDYLKKKKYNNIILIGHSEGSLIGMLAAQQREVSKFISLSGPGRNIEEVLIQQLSEQAPELIIEIQTILSVLKQGKMVDNVSPELSSLFRTSIQPYIISWLKYSPKNEIEKLEIPVLILHGSTDIQITEEDAKLQKEGNPKAKLIIIEEMNHVLKEASDNKDENMKTYYNPKLPLHKELIPVLVEFINN